MNAEDLALLIEGLRDFTDPEAHFPTYPPKLQRSMNRLSLFMAADYPATVSGLLRLFEGPVASWWPGEVPDGFSEQVPLLVEGGLSEEARAFSARETR